MPIDDELKGSERRFWGLIDERTKPDADHAAIDRRIWDLFGDVGAVMFTDLAGFSRQVAKFGIVHFLQEIYVQKRLLLPIVADHDGILLKIEADSFMIFFKRARSALKCAIAMQHACQRFNVTRSAENTVLLCVGIGYGELLRLGDVDLWGREVNAASKLGEDVAKANQILISRATMQEIGAFEGASFQRIESAVPGSDENYEVVYPHAM